MLQERRIAVVIPAYCEARLIGRTIATLPDFVDAIYVVDDGSPDDTSLAAAASTDARLRVLRHEKNRGVGATIITGYRAALAEHADVVAVMAGDAQMDPADLPAVLAPVVAGRADYVKGNRFRSRERRNMPWLRRVAGQVLSLATRLASGLDVNDCQCGFTAVSRRALATLPLGELSHSYLFRAIVQGSEVRLEYHLLSCKFDPSAEVPPELYRAPGALVPRAR